MPPENVCLINVLHLLLFVPSFVSHTFCDQFALLVFPYTDERPTSQCLHGFQMKFIIVAW